MAGRVEVLLTPGTGSLVASQIIKVGTVRVQEVVCTNTSAGVLYCQIFDSATLPADTAAPDIVFAVPANSTASYDNQQGLIFPAGLTVCISSTAHTKTIAGAVAVFHTLTET